MTDAPRVSRSLAIFERLAISEEDRQEILAGWPAPEQDPEIWQSLERAYGTLVKDLGGFEPLALPGPVVESTPGLQSFEWAMQDLNLRPPACRAI